MRKRKGRGAKTWERDAEEPGGCASGKRGVAEAERTGEEDTLGWAGWADGGGDGDDESTAVTFDGRRGEERRAVVRLGGRKNVVVAVVGSNEQREESRGGDGRMVQPGRCSQTAAGDRAIVVDMCAPISKGHAGLFFLINA